MSKPAQGFLKLILGFLVAYLLIIYKKRNKYSNFAF